MACLLCPSEFVMVPVKCVGFEQRDAPDEGVHGEFSRVCVGSVLGWQITYHPEQLLGHIWKVHITMGAEEALPFWVRLCSAMVLTDPNRIFFSSSPESSLSVVPPYGRYFANRVLLPFWLWAYIMPCNNICQPYTFCSLKNGWFQECGLSFHGFRCMSAIQWTFGELYPAGSAIFRCFCCNGIFRSHIWL